MHIVICPDIYFALNQTAFDESVLSSAEQLKLLNTCISKMFSMHIDLFSDEQIASKIVVENLGDKHKELFELLYTE